jgi:hypothetical protein
MAKAKQLPSKREAFDRAYDKSHDGQVNTAFDRFTAKMDEAMRCAFENTLRDVKEAWQEGATFTARRPMSEEQRALVAGDQPADLIS